MHLGLIQSKEPEIHYAYQTSSNETESADTQPQPLVSPLVLYLAIGVIVLIILILIYLLCDLYIRCVEEKPLEMLDGGPPLVPGQKPNVYTINMKVGTVGASFDVGSSIIKIELLDHYNQYLTTITVPSFVFKFRNEANGRLDAFEGHEGSAYVKKPTQPKTLNQQINFKSLSDYYDLWSGKRRNDSVCFKLVRCNPLTNLAAIRLSHDCHYPNAYLTLDYVTIKDEQSGQEASALVQNKKIRAINICHPSSSQVFNLERLSP